MGGATSAGLWQFESAQGAAGALERCIWMGEQRPEEGEEERIAGDADDREKRQQVFERRLGGGDDHPEPSASGRQQRRSKRGG